MMKTQEVFLAPVFDDFAVGDRVYRYNSFTRETVFGNITKIYPDAFQIKIDDDAVANAGDETYITFSFFERDNDHDSMFVTHWAKALDLSEVFTGSVLSLVDYENQTRQYFDVFHFPTNKTFIRLTFEDSTGKLENKLLADEHVESLEFQLKDYVLEG